MASFWNSSLVEPKRKNRWKFLLPSANGGVITEWMVKDVKKPSMSIAAVEHKFGQHTFKWPGNAKWDETSFTVVDPAFDSLDAARTLINKLVAAGYKTPTGIDNALTFMTKAKALAAIGTPQIIQLGSDNLVPPLEVWTLHNAFITKMDFGELNYEGDGDLVTVSLSLTYDYATLEKSALQGGNS